MTDADRQSLATWLDADPEHRWVLSRYRQLSAQLGEQFGAAADSLTIADATGRRQRWRIYSGVMAAAAAVAILIAVLAGRPREFATRIAERHVATLNDGSHIELNAQTSLSVDFSRSERRVRLMRGEALFTVAKDSTRPFLVETPSGVVRVTGTIFNVRAARDERVEVTVLEGNVRVRATNTPAETALVPGAQAVLAAEKVALRELPQGAAQDAVAWREGRVVFNDTPLAEALERFSGYHAQVIAADSGVADLRLGGRYALDDLNGFLDSLERVLGVRVVREANGTLRATAR
jgi:transmembrane sensor